MEDHESYYAKRSEDEDENYNNNILYNRTSREDDSLLVDLVKGYSHLYNKQSKDFKDIKKRNNSWEEIGEILNATGIGYIFLLYHYYIYICVTVLIYFNNYNVFLMYKYSRNVCASKIDFYSIYICFSCGLSDKMGKTTRTIFS